MAFSSKQAGAACKLAWWRLAPCSVPLPSSSIGAASRTAPKPACNDVGCCSQMRVQPLSSQQAQSLCPNDPQRMLASADLSSCPARRASRRTSLAVHWRRRCPHPACEPGGEERGSKRVSKQREERGGVSAQARSATFKPACLARKLPTHLAGVVSVLVDVRGERGQPRLAIAVQRLVALEPHVAALAPGGAPAVLDQPAAGAVQHKIDRLDGMQRSSATRRSPRCS